MAEAEQKQFKAVLIGATGAVGRYLFAELVQAKVILFVCFFVSLIFLGSLDPKKFVIFSFFILYC